jgi:hypothetical protein
MEGLRLKSLGRLIALLLLSTTFVATMLACRFTSFLPGKDHDVEDQNPVEELPAGVANNQQLAEALSSLPVDDRPGVLAELGMPDAFDISVLQVEGGQVRMESWRYYQYGTRVDFVDGEAVWTMEIDPLPEGTLFSAWYNPLDFEIGMTTDQVSALLAGKSPAGMLPSYIDLSQGGEDLVGGMILAGDQVLVGLDNDRLVYVETVALVPEGGE